MYGICCVEIGVNQPWPWGFGEWGDHCEGNQRKVAGWSHLRCLWAGAPPSWKQAVENASGHHYSSQFGAGHSWGCELISIHSSCYNSFYDDIVCSELLRTSKHASINLCRRQICLWRIWNSLLRARSWSMLWTGQEVTEQYYTMTVTVVDTCLEIHTIHVIFLHFWWS